MLEVFHYKQVDNHVVLIRTDLSETIITTSETIEDAKEMANFYNNVLLIEHFNQNRRIH